ncbi:hypothetical protein GF373_00955, partial [bacterium]|nr:hypothetical protein [bacterium]
MKRIGLHIALIGMLLCIGGIAFANDNEKTYIVLPEKHIVQFATQTVVRLGDLATAIKTPDESLLPGLKAVKLMDAPKVGEKARIGHALIMQQIRSAGFDFFNTKLVGANLTFVYGAGQKITVESLVKAIQQHVKKETDWSNDELVLRILSTPTKDCWLPPGEYEMEIDCMNPRTLGTARYEIRFFQNKILVDKAPFVVSISHQRSIFVPTRNIRRGEIIAKDDLREIQQLIQNDMLDRQIIASKK